LVTEEELDALYAENTASGTFLEPPVGLAVVDDGDPEPDDLEVQPTERMAPAAFTVPEGPSPWERQRGEPVRAYHAFCHFRDQKVHSCAVAYRVHKRECEQQPVADDTDAPRRWRLWSSEWGWVERAALWDAEIDRQHREKLVQTQLEARERHARLGQAILTVLSLPVKAALEAARDPAIVQKMIEAAGHGPAGSYQLLAAIARMASVIPSVVTMERQAVGMTTVRVEVEEQREFDVSFADRVVKDPVATELAIQLLDRVTRQPVKDATAPEPARVW
jgi:hypothetical protein